MKKTIHILVISLFILVLTSCNSNSKSLDSHINFPNEPYSLDDHPLIKDPYAFYDLSGAQVRYWGSANVHDPVMIKEGEYYYIFSTDAQFGVTSQKGIHIRKTKDFIQYEFVTTALDLDTVTDAIDYIEYNRDGELVNFFWAPEIYRKEKEDGSFEYWLYYSNSSFGQRTSYMGLAKSNAIEGPYIHESEILRTHQSVGSPNAIDPAIFTEIVDGIEKMYLSYGSWSAGIYIIELDPNTGRPLIEQTLEEAEVSVNTQIPGQTTTKTKLIPVANDAAFGTRILNIYSAEAPYIIKEGAYYYLFVTTGIDLTYDYNTRVFRSTEITGPYVDSENNPSIAQTNRDTFRKYGNMITDAHEFLFDPQNGELQRGWSGIGHSAALKDGDEWLFISHYRGTHIDKDRFFFGARRMHFVDGWPVIEANRYVQGGSMDQSKVDISGTYQVHILNKLVMNSSLNNNVISIIKKASIINLTKHKLTDNWYEVTGYYNGKWRYHEDNLELELESILYHGIITPQFQFERHLGTLSFSLINEKGYTIWGNRYV